MSHKPLPKKLEDDLNGVKHYKPQPPAPNENLPNGNLNGRRKSVPNTIQKVFDDSVERSMYDEIFGHMLPQQRASQQTKFAAGSAVEATRQAVSGTDFTTNLLQRLRVVEKEAKEMRERLAEEIRKNELLHDENEKLKKSTEEPGYILQQMNHFKHENIKLAKKIIDMEEFLADYGLVWVGKNEEKSCQPRRLNEGKENTNDDDDEEVEENDGDINNEEHHQHPYQQHLSYADFAKAVQELNAIIYSEPSQVMTDNRKARLVSAVERTEKIRIIFYQNGIMIQNGPFRPNHSSSFQSFVQDIVDGYFPSEFKNQYPDGVLFDLLDHHSIPYTNEHFQQHYSLSSSQFLSRLPKAMIKDGEIINIRNDIEEKLGKGKGKGGSSSSHLQPSNISNNLNNNNNNSKMTTAVTRPTTTTIATTNILNTFVTRNKLLEQSTSNHQPSKEEIVHIHIRWCDEKKTVFQAAMFAHDTIQHLREEIARHLTIDVQTDLHCTTIELRSAYPSKLLTDEMTFKEAGLVPNGTIHSRKLQ
jgi:hypothetical protein